MANWRRAFVEDGAMGGRRNGAAYVVMACVAIWLSRLGRLVDTGGVVGGGAPCWKNYQYIS